MVDLLEYEVVPLKWEKIPITYAEEKQFNSQGCYIAKFILGERAVAWGHFHAEYFYDCFYRIIRKVDSNDVLQGFHLEIYDGKYYKRSIPKDNLLHATLEVAQAVAQKDYEDKIVEQLFRKKKIKKPRKNSYQ